MAIAMRALLGFKRLAEGSRGGGGRSGHQGLGFRVSQGGRIPQKP